MDVLEVYLRVREKMPARLLFLGDGPDRAKVEARCREVGCCDGVVFLGNHPAVEEILHGADLFLLPSAGESFGLAALEALSCEVPVIAADAGGVPEVIEEGVDGLLFPVGDVDAHGARGDRAARRPRAPPRLRAARPRARGGALLRGRDRRALPRALRAGARGRGCAGRRPPAGALRPGDGELPRADRRGAAPSCASWARASSPSSRRRRAPRPPPATSRRCASGTPTPPTTASPGGSGPPPPSAPPTPANPPAPPARRCSPCCAAPALRRRRRGGALVRRHQAGQGRPGARLRRRAAAGARRAADPRVLRRRRLAVTLPYERIGAVKRLLQPPAVELVAERYGEAVELELEVDSGGPARVARGARRPGARRARDLSAAELVGFPARGYADCRSFDIHPFRGGAIADERACRPPAAARRTRQATRATRP